MSNYSFWTTLNLKPWPLIEGQNISYITLVTLVGGSIFLILQSLNFTFNSSFTHNFRLQVRSIEKKMMLREDDPSAKKAEFYAHIW